MTIAKDTSPTYNCPAQANGEGAVENGSGVGKEGTSVSSTTDTTFPPRPLPLEPSPEELLQCQFSSWFPKFRYLPKDLFGKRTNVTIKSEIITALPDEFIDFLHSDGIRLPEGATQLSSCAPNEQPQAEEEVDENDDDNDNDISRQFSFPQLNQDIAAAIESLGGDVIPKLNWSTPKDATWVNEGTLKCRTPGDVYLLLKSSDFCMHDLQQYDSLKEISSEKFTMDASSQRDPPRLELVLRKWCNLYPSMEFRCFVRSHTLSESCCVCFYLCSYVSFCFSIC